MLFVMFANFISAKTSSRLKENKLCTSSLSQASSEAKGQGVNKSCIVVVEEKQTWESSNAICKAKGGGLATFPSAVEERTIAHMINEMNGIETWWIGLRYDKHGKIVLQPC